MMWLPIASALAQDECFQSFTEFDVRALLAQSNAATYNDDTVAHKRLFDEFVSRVPCLEAQLPKDAWAQMLVNEAVYRKVTGAAFDDILGTALEIYPEIPDVPEILMDEYAPPPPVRFHAQPIPEDATLFVDGVLQPKVPVIEGEHVLQLWRDGKWTNLFVEDQQVPPDWLVPKPEKIREVVLVEEVWEPAGRGVVGAGLGFTLGRQMIEDPPGAPPPASGTDEFLADNRTVGVLSSIGSFGVQPIASSAGLLWDVLVTFQAPTLRSETAVEGGPTRSKFEEGLALMPSAWFGPAAILEHLHVGAGAGFSRLAKVEGDERSLPFYPQPHLALGVRSTRADLEISGGLTPAALHAGMRGGWLLSDPRALSWRLGFEANVGTAWFSEAGGERSATALQVGVLGRLDASWGRDR